jgi:endo-1,3-1,4-beta-glycanase ExoK
VKRTNYNRVALVATVLSCSSCTDGTAARSSPRQPTVDAPAMSPPQPGTPARELPELTAPTSGEGETSASGTSTTLGSNAGEAEPMPADPFQLLWEDSFDFIDSTRWSAQTHSWDGNLAQFTQTNVATANGRLQLSLTSSGNASKPFNGVEYRSRDTITYGKVEASMRFAKGSGVVSSLVLIYTPWPPDDWNELDIECLGNTTGEVQFNHMVNIPPADPASSHLQFPRKVQLGFDPTAAFHTYAIEWLPRLLTSWSTGSSFMRPLRRCRACGYLRTSCSPSGHQTPQAGLAPLRPPPHQRLQKSIGCASIRTSNCETAPCPSRPLPS